jgi:hypothetical protein
MKAPETGDKEIIPPCKKKETMECTPNRKATESEDKEIITPCKRKLSMRCAQRGRSNIPKSVSDENDLRFHMVPLYPAESRSKNIKLNSVIMREGQILIHKKVMDWIGCSRKCRTKKYICEDHIIKWIMKYHSFNWRGKTCHQAY